MFIIAAPISAYFNVGAIFEPSPNTATVLPNSYNVSTVFRYTSEVALPITFKFVSKS